MRYIDINDLKETLDRIKDIGSFSDWNRRAKEHAAKLEDKSKEERNKYWKTNNIWSELYSALSTLSGDKCWYTEAKENSSEWNIDHFRPKSKSLDEDGGILLNDGYWWLSYDWKNYRLCGTLVNLLRKGRFDEGEEALGKGSFFPLKDRAKISKEKDMSCSGETPILLDPTSALDVSLLSFDEDGMPYPTYNVDENAFKNLRSSITIKCYGLQHKSLVRGRSRVWSACHNIVEETQNVLLVNHDDEEKIDSAIEKCFDDLATLANRKMPHSIVVFNYIRAQSIEKNYEWLKDAVIAIA
jgi:hypothetical protein